MKNIKTSKLTKLILISFLIYSIVFVIHGLIVTFADTDFSILISDQLVFYNRGLGVLRGEVPYRDFYTHAAPLSPYLWFFIVSISMLLTGDFSTESLQLETYMNSPGMMFSSYVFRVFFAFCLILSAVLLLKILEKKKIKMSFWIAFSYSINPYFLYLTSFWGSDECILPLLLILPIYLLEEEKYYLASLSLAVGTGLKYFPILLLPLLLIYNKNLRMKVIQLSITLIGILGSYLPFYFIDSESFLKQFNYPLDNSRNQGIMALDDYFSNYEFSVVSNYEFLTLAVVFIGFVGAVLYLTKQTWTFEKSMALTIPFLIFFPKIQFSYFIIMFPFLFVMIFRNDNISVLYACIFLCTLIGGAAADYILSYDGTNILSYIASWVITIVLYLCMIFALVHLILTKNLQQFTDKSSK